MDSSCYANSKASSVDSCDGYNTNAVSYIQIKVLGQGSYGRAVLFRNTMDSCLVVWKEVTIKRHKLNEIQKEIDILSILDHPNIIGYYNHFVHLDTVYIEMEYANGGTLSHYLTQISFNLPESDVLWFLFQLINGLEYVHNLHIIHRDVKPINIFMNTNSLLKIGDFGISKQLKEDEEKAETQIGTPMYMAPEVLQGVRYSSKSDIWSCGCVLYEIMAQRYLFESSNQLNLALKIINRQFQPMPSNYSVNLMELLNKLLLSEPDNRPNCSEILKDKIWEEEQIKAMKQSIIDLNQRNRKIPRPMSGSENKEILSLNSETFVWGGGKVIPAKVDIFKDNKAGLIVAAGENHFVVLTVEGELYSWASQHGTGTSVGQLGHGKNTYKTPHLVQELSQLSIRTVSCGAENSYCLTISGDLYGCGSNYYGQMGLGSLDQESYNTYVKIPIINSNTKENEALIQLSSGHCHVMVVTSDTKRLYSWGCGEFGRLGLGDENDRCEPCLVNDDPILCSQIFQIVCGPDCSFVILSPLQRVLACGNNEYNKLGTTAVAKLKETIISYDVLFETKLKLVQPLRNIEVAEISCGDHHTALVDVYNCLYTFGSNKYGQLGLGDTRSRCGINKSSKLLTGKLITRVSCGDKYTIIITKTNEIYGWGLFDHGRLGIPEKVGRSNFNYFCHPTPLFGVLWKCADICSYKWHTIMIAERILETNTITNSCHAFDIGHCIVKRRETDDDENNISTGRCCDNMTASTSSSQLPSWLKDELEDAEVINRKDAEFINISDNSQSYICSECNCGHFANYIRELENKIEVMQCEKDFLLKSLNK